MWLFLYVWTRELSKINGVWHQLKTGHYLFCVDMGKRILLWFTWHICILWLPGKAWFSPRSHTYSAAAYLSCVSKENFVTQTLKRNWGGTRNSLLWGPSALWIGDWVCEGTVCSEDLSCFVPLFESPSLFILSLLCSVMLEGWKSCL